MRRALAGLLRVAEETISEVRPVAYQVTIVDKSCGVWSTRRVDVN